MDIKKRTKNIKLKLERLGYKVKHTHCQEVLAVANGFRSFHHLKGKSQISDAMDVLLPKDVYLTVGVDANTTNEYYTEKIQGVKVHFDQNKINELIEARDLIKDKEIVVELLCDRVIPFEGFDEEKFEQLNKSNKCLNQPSTSYPLESIDVMDLMNEDCGYLSKDFYLEENCFHYDGEIYSRIRASKYGVSIVVSIADKHQEVFFSSYSLSWDRLNLECKNKLN